MNFRFDTSNLEKQMKQYGIGRVMFAGVFANRKSNVYFANDVGKKVLLFEDAAHILPSFCLETLNVESDIYNGFMDIKQIMEWCLSDKQFPKTFISFTGEAVERMQNLKIATTDICIYLEEVIKKVMIPDIKETKNIPYYTLPTLIMKDNEKPYLSFLRTANKNGEQNYMKSVYAFGKDVVDRIYAEGKVVNWTNNKKQEMLNILEDYLQVGNKVYYINYRERCLNYKEIR